MTQEIELLFPKMVAHRRHLHQNPELSYKEFKTTAYIQSELEKLGYQIHRPLETGIVAVLNPENKSKRVLAFRADIDALPIHEEGEAKQSFLSKNEGVAHCCGHDMHTANMLGVAELLKVHQHEIQHKIILIFQPAEEKLPGGGRLMMESGILQKLGVTEIFGLHTSPKYPVGTIALKNGPLMARPDEFVLTIKGRGGHAAAPHDAVDPIVIAAQIISTIQSVVSRTVEPTESAVVTIGSIHGGSVHNVIPEKVEMKGTIRSFRQELANQMSKTIELTAKGIAKAFGGDSEFQFDPGYPAVINTEKTTETVREIVRDLYGENALFEMEKPIMAGEDFAFYQQEFPGTFFFLGTSSEETQSVFPWHHPKYNADENGMKFGAPIFLRLALSK